MLIVGERINTSRKPVAEAAEKRDSDFIIKEAKSQEEAGANFIDVNAGTFAEREKENLMWLVQTLRDNVSIPLCIDSSDPDVVAAALEYCNEGTMVNSITAEKDNYAAMLPLMKKYRCRTIALSMDDNGIHNELDKKLDVCFSLIDNLLSEGIDLDNIYVDPLVMAVSTGQDGGVITLNTIAEIRKRFAEVHIICGLSNISFGVPVRSLLNRTFLTMAMTVGLDAVIFDPLDKQMMASLLAANAILGNDSYCREYLSAYRNKKLE